MAGESKRSRPQLSRTIFLTQQISVINSTAQESTGLLFSLSAPLLEEKCDVLPLAGFIQFFHPPFLHWPGAWTGLAADDGPVNSGQIRLDDGPSNGSNETNRMRAGNPAQQAHAVEIIFALHRGTEPNIREQRKFWVGQ